MVNYKCSICNRKFNHKGDYKRHINRKNKCKEKSSQNIQKLNNKNIVPKKEQSFQTRNVERFICIYCNRSYSRRPNLNKHLKTCNSKKQNELKEKMFELLLKKMEKQEESYGKQIKILQNKIDNLSTGTINNYTTNNNIQQNNNIINVLAYNKTDISHLKDKDYKKVLRRGNFCVPNLVDAIHFNPNKPENHNIYIPNMKTGYIMCWNGDSWDIRNREDVIDDIYDDKSNLLIDKVDEWEDIGYKLDPIIMTKFKRFIKKMDDDIVKNKVKEEIRFLLYNKRNKINNKIKN
jgi:hypothetical protein